MSVRVPCDSAGRERARSETSVWLSLLFHVGFSRSIILALTAAVAILRSKHVLFTPPVRSVGSYSALHLFDFKVAHRSCIQIYRSIGSAQPRASQFVCVCGRRSTRCRSKKLRQALHQLLSPCRPCPGNHACMNEPAHDLLVMCLCKLTCDNQAVG